MAIEVVQKDRPIEMFLTLPNNNSVSLRFQKQVSEQVWGIVLEAIRLLKESVVEEDDKPEVPRNDA